MSNIAIAGDTSGTVTLQAPAIAGTTTLTLPSTSGTVVTSSNINTYTRSGASYATLTTGTTNITLTSSSNQLQIVSADQEGCSITLPDATTLTLGSGYFQFYNASIYPIAVKDAGGTIREYLYPNNVNLNSATLPTGASSSTLSLQENSNANGVWHIEKTTLSVYGLLASYVSTTITNTGSGLGGVIRVNATEFIWLSYTYNTSGGSWYAKLFTYNPSTKTFTAGNSVTLATAGTNVTPYTMTGDSNGVDRGIITIGSSWISATSTNNVRAFGFATVSGTLYVSASSTIASSSSSQSAFSGAVQYVGSNNAFFCFGYGDNSSGTNATATAYTVGVAGTTVTITQCTGSQSYAAIGSYYCWIATNTSRTTWLVDASDGTGSKYYLSYDPSTNVMTGGARTSMTTNIVTAGYINQYDRTLSGLGQLKVLSNSTSTKILYTPTNYQNATSNKCFAVTNAGTATVTITPSSFSAKPYAGKNYGTTTGLGVTDIYIVSSSNYLVIDQSTNTLYSADPTNANFNINYCAYYVPATNFLTSATNIIGLSGSLVTATANQYTPATPFVS